MNNRREFLKGSAMGAAATLLPKSDLIGSPTPTSAQDGRLKKGALITMLPRQMSYLDRFKLAVDVGFEGIEAQTVADPKEAEQIKEASEKAKIRIHSVMNVVIAIEPVWNKFLLTPYDTAKYVDQFKSRRLNAYFDVGNVVMYGFPQEWIRALGKRIVKFHLKDFKYETRQWVPLRECSIDWKEVRKAIGEIGFKGYLTVELQGGDEAYLREVSRRVDMILAGE